MSVQQARCISAMIHFMNTFNMLFLLATGFIAWHGITYRGKDGQNDIGHMLFGCIALVFFLRVLFINDHELFIAKCHGSMNTREKSTKVIIQLKR